MASSTPLDGKRNTFTDKNERPASLEKLSFGLIIVLWSHWRNVCNRNQCLAQFRPFTPTPDFSTKSLSDWTTNQTVLCGESGLREDEVSCIINSLERKHQSVHKDNVSWDEDRDDPCPFLHFNILKRTWWNDLTLTSEKLRINNKPIYCSILMLSLPWFRTFFPNGSG